MASISTQSFYGQKRNTAAHDTDSSENGDALPDEDDNTLDDTEESEEDVVLDVSNMDLESTGSSEESDPADDDDSAQIPEHGVTARSGRAYVFEPPRVHRRGIQNIVREREGVLPDGHADSVLESFMKFFTTEIIQDIVLHSNEEAAMRNLKATDDVEILAVIGVLIIMGANSDTDQSVEVWSDINGRPQIKLFAKLW